MYNWNNCNRTIFKYTRTYLRRYIQVMMYHISTLCYTSQQSPTPSTWCQWGCGWRGPHHWLVGGAWWDRAGPLQHRYIQPAPDLSSARTLIRTSFVVVMRAMCRRFIIHTCGMYSSQKQCFLLQKIASVWFNKLPKTYPLCVVNICLWSCTGITFERIYIVSNNQWIVM